MLGPIFCTFVLSRSSGLSSNDESKLPNDYFLIFDLFNLATISQQFLFLTGLPSKSGDRSSLQKVTTTVYEKWHPKKFGL
jgi:hypothetical protein